MPLQTKPEDKPAPVRFSVSEKDDVLEVTVSLLPLKKEAPWVLQGGTPQFENRDAFKARVVEVGLSPAVAEDQGRSFNATARQLRELGFLVGLPQEEAGGEPKAA